MSPPATLHNETRKPGYFPDPNTTEATLLGSSLSESISDLATPWRKTAGLRGTHPEATSAGHPNHAETDPVLDRDRKSPPMVPAELGGLAEGAELLCAFPFRPRVTKYRLLRRGRIVDMYSIPHGEPGAWSGLGASMPRVHVLLVPSPAIPAEEGERPALWSKHRGAGEGRPEERAGRGNRAGRPSIPPSHSAWGGGSTALHADYVRLGSTVAPASGRGVLDGTAVVFAPLSLGDPRQRWPTSVPVCGAARLVVALQPVPSQAPVPDPSFVEHLVTLHRLDAPVGETVVLFKPGPLDDGPPSAFRDSDGAWLAELLGTLFASVPSHHLGAVSVVGLESVAPRWPREHGQARDRLARMLDGFVHAAASPARRDWSDVMAASFLSLEAYRATVGSAQYELETCYI